MDKECVVLCDAINLFSPKIKTIESCCGHGQNTYRIWLHIEGDGLAELPSILYWIDSCHSGCVGWTCTVYTDCGMSPVTFMIEGPIGKQAYDDARHIAGKILSTFNEEMADVQT